METEVIMTKTKAMIDDLKTVCANYGLGNASSEYKIITEVFLYKFLNDKFLHEVRQTSDKLKNSANIEADLAALSVDDYGFMLASLPPATAQLKKEHFISYLFNRKNTDKFNELFDDTLVDIANFNIDVFSVKTGSADKIRLFDAISVFVTETNKRSDFCRALIDKLIAFSFEDAFSQKYDFFAAVFEYLIKDYNKDFGKYAEYYTPHSIASIIAKIMVPEGVKNVTVYDPAAGSGTLVLALAHEIGEDNCTIYTQDISQKSNEFLRLNLILNNLVHSLGNVVHGDTLLHPEHLNKQKNGLAKFDYVVSNPPFNMDFSDSRDTLAGDNYKERFWAGVPAIPKKDKNSMDVYLLFIQHIIYSIKEKFGHAAIVVPTGFLTKKNKIEKCIRQYILDNKMLKGVISMPSNIFATTGTNVSIMFLDAEKASEEAMLVDATGLGDKVKVDGKNQKTVLKNDEIQKIISTFKEMKEENGFSVVVPLDKIAKNKLSFSAGQYFEAEIKYIDLSPDEFNKKIDGYLSEMEKLFNEEQVSNTEIRDALRRLHYDI
jgi:type I restriction enzyme M protein